MQNSAESPGGLRQEKRQEFIEVGLVSSFADGNEAHDMRGRPKDSGKCGRETSRAGAASEADNQSCNGGKHREDVPGEDGQKRRREEVKLRASTGELIRHSPRKKAEKNEA